MLNYYQQYNIANGIFICFDTQSKVRLLSSRHGKDVRDKMKNVFPYLKYETYTKENFILSCLYIVLFKTPSSYRAMVSSLHNLDKKDVFNFKQDILNYDSLITKDINYLNEKYKFNLNITNVLREFSQNNIQFYTAWFYYQYTKENKEHLNKSRVYSLVLRKLRFIMLYVTFREKSITKIKKLFEVLEL